MGDDRKQLPGSAIVRTQAEASSALQRITGKPANEEVYWCMSCGFAEDPNDPAKVRYPKGLTLKFDEDEIAALAGDLSAYTGPCPVCEFMTLVPMDRFTGGTIQQMARENRAAENREMAKTFVDVVKEEIAGGSLFDGGPVDPGAAAVPGQRPDLPDADGIDESQLKPRGES